MDRLIRLRWLLLSAVSAGACGGSVDANKPDAGGSGGDEPAAGTRNTGAVGAGGHLTSGGKTSTAGSGGSSGTSATGVTHGECEEPQLAKAGFVSCADGLVHRVEKAECENKLPAEPVTCGVEPDTYVCDGTKREACGSTGGGTPPATSCAVGCVADSDCDAGQICYCGADLGTCVAATCSVDADCADGYFCRFVQTEHDIGCGAVLSFQCQLPDDSCASATDCGTGGGYGQRCQPALAGTPLRCEPIEGVACGRPFLINGTPRLACLVANTDWAAALELDPSALEASTREGLAQGWNQLGLLEHASVAAFARFTLQLLALGAPHALVLESNRAILDETHHAELCFGLAAAFGSKAAGPGKLDSQGALGHSSLTDVVLDTFVEGCVGETVAALEATEALAHAAFPAVRQVLEQIAADEARHAALAFRFVAWGIAQAPELLDGLQARLERELEGATQTCMALAEQLRPGRDALTAGGLLSDSARAQLRLQALREVVTPCLAACSARPEKTHGAEKTDGAERHTAL